MKKLLFIICLLIPCVLLCQNNTTVIPGYLGKKWVIDYTLNIMPSFIIDNPGKNTDYVDYEEEGRKFYFNTQHKFSIERVVGRKLSVVGTMLFSKNQANFDLFRATEKDFIQIDTRGYIFTLRHYRKHLAPISTYFDYKIGYYNIRPGDFSYELIDDNDSTLSPTISAGSTGDLYLGFGLGNSRVIKDRVIISFGLEVGLLLGGMLDAFDGSSQFATAGLENPNSRQNREAVHALAKRRMFFESLMNFTVRLGFMP